MITWLKSRHAKAIVAQMNEKRPLPLGAQEFEEWSDRIISGSLLPAEPDGMKFALASMLMHLGPTVDHETDGYFIKSLRKAAINQVAHAKLTAIKEAHQAQAKEKENEDKRKLELVPDPQRGPQSCEPGTGSETTTK